MPTPDIVTRIPFAFARSGLFRPGNGPRKNAIVQSFDNHCVPSSLDYAIELTTSGPPLRSCHALAWQAVVALALHRATGLTTVEFFPAEILRLMGRQDRIVKDRARTWLRALLEDLCACGVVTTTPIHSHAGPLLASVTALPQGKLAITFDPGMELFLQNEYVAVPLSHKNHLGDHPLAQWLHDYIATHKDTYVASVETIHRLCGSTLNVSTFRTRLKQALDTLVSGPACLTSYTLEGDKLTLRKQKTTVVRLTQERVLAAKHQVVRHRSAIEQARMQRAKTPL